MAGIRPRCGPPAENLEGAYYTRMLPRRSFLAFPKNLLRFTGTRIAGCRGGTRRYVLTRKDRHPECCCRLAAGGMPATTARSVLHADVPSAAKHDAVIYGSCCPPSTSLSTSSLT